MVQNTTTRKNLIKFVEEKVKADKISSKSGFPKMVTQAAASAFNISFRYLETYLKNYHYFKRAEDLKVNYN